MGGMAGVSPRQASEIRELEKDLQWPVESPQPDA